METLSLNVGSKQIASIAGFILFLLLLYFIHDYTQTKSPSSNTYATYALAGMSMAAVAYSYLDNEETMETRTKIAGLKNERAKAKAAGNIAQVAELSEKINALSIQGGGKAKKKVKAKVVAKKTAEKTAKKAAKKVVKKQLAKKAK